MQMGSPRLTFSWCRRSHFDCCTGCSSCETIVGASCGSVSLRTRRPNGSPLRSYQQYYNGTRTHLSLGKDSPVPRAVHATGSILPLPILGGLHHHYVRI